MDAAMRVFEITKGFPSEEKYSLVDQVRRSSRSICANLAEAWRKRRYEAHFVSKMSDAERKPKKLAFGWSSHASAVTSARNSLKNSMTLMTRSWPSWSKCSPSLVSGGSGKFAVSPCRRVAASVFLLLTLLSCHSNPKKVIGVVPKATSHLFWVSVQAGAMTAGHDLGVEVQWNGPATETDYSRQIEIVDSMIARHVDGLALAAQDHTALDGTLDRAAREGIPVTVFDSGVDSTNYMTFVATNNYEAGQMAARKLAELLHGKGSIAMVLHVPGSFSTMERERGFEEATAKEFPQIQIVQKQYGMSDRSKAMAAAENILTAHPNLDGIFGSTEPSSIGTALALKSRGLAGKIKFVAFDAAEGMIEDLKNGTIDALVAQDPFRIGYEAVRTLVDKLNGKTPPKRIDLSAHVITKADLDKPEIKALLNPDVKKYLQ
jgi:ribose transport system substrate-binding protein